MLLDLGRTADAIEAHLTAVHRSRHPLRPWTRAAALVHLADTLDATGEADRARLCRADAEALLADVQDPAATELHEHVRALLQRRSQ